MKADRKERKSWDLPGKFTNRLHLKTGKILGIGIHCLGWTLKMMARRCMKLTSWAPSRMFLICQEVRVWYRWSMEQRHGNMIKLFLAGYPKFIMAPSNVWCSITSWTFWIYSTFTSCFSETNIDISYRFLLGLNCFSLIFQGYFSCYP